MLDIKTPIDKIFRMTLNLDLKDNYPDANTLDVSEGEWVMPSPTNPDTFVPASNWGTTIANAPNVVFQCWLDQKRPDSYASVLPGTGSGTTAVPFGKYIAITDKFEKAAPVTAVTDYAPGAKLTVRNRVLVPCVGDLATAPVHAISLVQPEDLTATATLKFAVL